MASSAGALRTHLTRPSFLVLWPCSLERRPRRLSSSTYRTNFQRAEHWFGGEGIPIAFPQTSAFTSEPFPRRTSSADTNFVARTGRPSSAEKGTFGAVRTDTGQSIGWSDGHFVGNRDMVTEAENLCSAAAAIDPFPFGPTTIADENDPVSVMMLMWLVCRGRLRWWGELPEHPWAGDTDDPGTVY
jgi:hypothetical protein